MPFVRSTPRTVIESGKLRQLVSILSPVAGVDSFGQPATSYSTVATVHARVVSLGGGETYGGDSFDPEITHIVTLRYMAGLTDNILPTQWIGVGTKVLDILFVNYGERRIDPVILHCKERVGQTLV